MQYVLYVNVMHKISQCFAELCSGSAEYFRPHFHHLLLQCFILSAQNDSTVQAHIAVIKKQ